MIGARTLERIGVGLFRASLLLLPRWLRDRAESEMIDVFLARHRRADGLRAVLSAWSTEIRGAVWTGLRARFGPAPALDVRRRPSHQRARRMDNLRKDIRYALRTLARRRTTAIAAILTLGLGIAASTAMFSVVDAVLLADLPFPDPDRIVRVYPSNPSIRDHPTLGDAADRGTFSPPEYAALRDMSQDVFASFAMVAGWSRPLVSEGEGPNERLAVGMTTYELLTGVLGVPPLRGRYPDRDDQAAERRVLVLTEGYWERRFGRDPGAVGRSLLVDGDPHEIIGVAPTEARLPGADYDVELWRLVAPNDNWGNHSWYGFGRLVDGMTPERATMELTRRFEGGGGGGHEHGINVYSEQAELVRGVEGPLLLLTAAALLLLLVAVGNVAVLLVGMALDRKRELAVRGALGAPRFRLFQQLLTEALVLSGAGAVVGVALAAAAARGLVFLAPEGIPRIEAVGVDLGVLGFAVSAALVSGVLAGILPSLSFSRDDFRSATASSRGATDRRARTQGTVVVAEIALATVLLVGGGLLVRTVVALQSIDPGFDMAETLSVGFSLPSSQLLEGVEGDSARYVALEQIKTRIADEVAALPGVVGAAYTSVLPLAPGRGNNQILPGGAEVAGEDGAILAERRFVTPGYFEVMGIDLLDGRTFTADDDRMGAPGVMVVSRGVAERAWPGESALGRRMDYWGRKTRVVGVVEDVNDENLRFGTDLAFYVPTHQADQYAGTLVVRAEGEPEPLIPSVRQRVLSAAPTAAVYDIRPMRAWAEAQMAAERYRARLATVFAVLAGFFSLIGVYAVTSRTVVARTREIGVRMALGAERDEILTRILGRAGRLALMGGVLGILLSLVAARFVEGFLFGVEAVDPVTLAVVAGTLALASIAAAWAPGRRATRVDPVTALRSE